MTLRLPLLLLLGSALAAACGGDTADPPPEVSAASADTAALEKIRADYVTHYNMAHAPVVAEFYSDSAIYLGADGSVDEGKAEIQAGLEAGMAAKPTLGLATDETIIRGDHAIGRGTYTLAMTPPGAASPVNVAGNYMTYFTRENGAWKIRAVVTNYDAPPPEGLPRAAADTAAPPENGTLKDLANEFATHYNMGHASVVAGLYTDDAVVAFPNAKPVQGRAAIEAALTALMAGGSPQVTIHDVGTAQIDAEWALDGGWYELKPKTGAATAGAYMLLARKAPDGTWKIHRHIGNTGPAAP
jgi:ketosteroid isomerase-like protein